MATREDWAERVKRWKKSGLTAAEFGEREGIEGRQLHWWKWHLGKKEVPSATELPLRLLPVRVVPARDVGVSKERPLEIVLQSGHVLRVARGFDPVTLRSVLSVLEEKSC
jgi:transposase